MAEVDSPLRGGSGATLARSGEPARVTFAAEFDERKGTWRAAEVQSEHASGGGGGRGGGGGGGGDAGPKTQTGTFLRFNGDFGFIRPDGGGDNVVVHRDDLSAELASALERGAVVLMFTAVLDDKKGILKAIEVEVRSGVGGGAGGAGRGGGRSRSRRSPLECEGFVALRSTMKICRIRAKKSKRVQSSRGQ